MAYRFIFLFILYGYLMYSVNCSTTIQSSPNVAPFLTYLCDDDLLKSAVNKVEHLTLKLENYNLRMQSELMAMKELLLREVKPPPATTKPSSCTEAMRHENGKYSASGVYDIHLPQFFHNAFSVYCLRDPNGGHPWTIIQRRQSNDTDFYRGWIEYEHGFGDLNANFFLGLDKIHALTHSQTHELWFQLEDFENEKRVANYDSFAIGNAQDKYELSVLGQYSGTAGDSFSAHRGEKFTTKDSHNDKNNENCAVLYTGAWWYQKCHASNLNGLYLGGEFPKDQYAKGVVWHSWHGHYYSLKYVHMAIRPKYYY